MHKRKWNGSRIFSIVNACLLILLVIVILYPLYFTIIASISDPMAVSAGRVTILPREITFDAYKEVFKNEEVWIGYRNSIFYTLFGTIFALFLTIPAAYVLSKKKLPGRNIISFFFVFTMFFGGGMIPFYLLLQNMNLLNKPYTLIIVGSFGVFNMVLARVYFESSIPAELYEAAEMDGCSNFGQFLKIALPLAKPVIAVIALYYAVGRWNDFFSGLLYVTDKDYYPLQLILRNILLESQNRLSQIDSNSISKEELSYLLKQAYMAQAMKYALIFISSLPMLIAYPFVQKHFTKGVMLGSLKG